MNEVSVPLITNYNTCSHVCRLLLLELVIASIVCVLSSERQSQLSFFEIPISLPSHVRNSVPGCSKA